MVTFRVKRLTYFFVYFSFLVMCGSDCDQVQLLIVIFIPSFWSYRVSRYVMYISDTIMNYLFIGQKGYEKSQFKPWSKYTHDLNQLEYRSREIWPITNK